MDLRDIADEVRSEIGRHDFRGREIQVLDKIIRYSLSLGKLQTPISAQDITEQTGLRVDKVNEILRDLEDLRVLIIDRQTGLIQIDVESSRWKPKRPGANERLERRSAAQVRLAEKQLMARLVAMDWLPDPNTQFRQAVAQSAVEERFSAQEQANAAPEARRMSRGAQRWISQGQEADDEGRQSGALSSEEGDAPHSPQNGVGESTPTPKRGEPTPNWGDETPKWGGSTPKRGEHTRARGNVYTLRTNDLKRTNVTFNDLSDTGKLAVTEMERFLGPRELRRYSSYWLEAASVQPDDLLEHARFLLMQAKTRPTSGEGAIQNRGKFAWSVWLKSFSQETKGPQP